MPARRLTAACVAALAAAGPECALLVNSAGGAIGLEPVAEADPADWHAMYETNVLGVLRLTRLCLPHMTLPEDSEVRDASINGIQAGIFLGPGESTEDVEGVWVGRDFHAEPVAVVRGYG